MKFLSVLFFVAGGVALHAAAPAKPNFIVIYTDDHGWADIGAAGVNKDLKTPNLDRLAAGGVYAPNGYVTAPQCVPSRAGLMSGRNQCRFGVESNGETLEGFDAQQTIAERLKQAGYATGMTGKWHLGPPPKITDHGFDDVYCNQGAGGKAWANFDLEGNTIPGAEIPSPLYHLEADAAAACAFIRRHKDRPFFFYIAFRGPHTPLDAPEKFTSRFPGPMPERRRQALAMISAIDDGVGRVLETLRKSGLEEKTLVFFMGDNGAPLKMTMEDSPLDGDAGGWDGSLNKPMNGEKGMLCEGGIRVPWLAYWKGRFPPGQVYPHPVVSLDVAATAAALAGVEVGPGELDGVNLVPYFSGEKKEAPHEALTWRWIAQSAIREGRWKLLIGGERSYLFDLGADPGETRDLKAEHPEIAARLRARLENWTKELSPPGLATKPMAVNWEGYYDFYLEGKPVPEGGSSRGGGDWIPHGATAVIRDGALRVTPGTEGKQHPFLSCARLEVPGPATAEICLRSEAGGRMVFAWRLDGQKDFMPGQTASVELAASPEWQDIRVPLPAQGRIIHLRLHLPAGETGIRRINLAAAHGKASRVWNYNGEGSAK